eukprot:jgi/Psemu1/249378/estExt_Genewise1Plus.C_40264
MSSQQRRQQRAPWQNAERHYCAVCNAWMGSDRQSIMLHENGKKHKENLEHALQEKRIEKERQEKAEKFLSDSLKQMEQAALAGSGVVPSNSYHTSQNTTSTRPSIVKTVQPGSNWNHYPHLPTQYSMHKNRPLPQQGQYSGTIYLEGEVFFGLLEEDLPVQLWTGSSASRVEKQQPENIRHWKNALVVAVVHHRPKNTPDKSDYELQRPTLHVSYLSSHEDTEETIEKKVTLDRIRIILGGDDKIPDDLEEARLLAMGGEEIHVSGSECANATATNDQQQIFNEATGLSAWSTVTIKKTTHRQHCREEKERFAEMKSQAARKREAEERRVVERRLEEARASNANDSALGAYDVWGEKDYKGVDISKEIHCSIEDTAKRLAPCASRQSMDDGKSGGPSTGGKVAFKKRAKKKGQRTARRRTSADDD